MALVEVCFAAAWFRSCFLCLPAMWCSTCFPSGGSLSAAAHLVAPLLASAGVGLLTWLMRSRPLYKNLRDLGVKIGETLHHTPNSNIPSAIGMDCSLTHRRVSMQDSISRGTVRVITVEEEAIRESECLRFGIWICRADAFKNAEQVWKRLSRALKRAFAHQKELLVEGHVVIKFELAAISPDGRITDERDVFSLVQRAIPHTKRCASNVRRGSATMLQFAGGNIPASVVMQRASIATSATVCKQSSTDHPFPDFLKDCNQRMSRQPLSVILPTS